MTKGQPEAVSEPLTWPCPAVFLCFCTWKRLGQGQGCGERPPVPSVNSCPNRSVVLGGVEPLPLACGRVVLRDTNTLHSPGLARSAAQGLSEFLLPLLWRGDFFAFIWK